MCFTHHYSAHIYRKMFVVYLQVINAFTVYHGIDFIGILTKVRDCKKRNGECFVFIVLTDEGYIKYHYIYPLLPSFWQNTNLLPIH